jgi:hypothetical protein
MVDSWTLFRARIYQFTAKPEEDGKEEKEPQYKSAQPSEKVSAASNVRWGEVAADGARLSTSFRYILATSSRPA